MIYFCKLFFLLLLHQECNNPAFYLHNVFFYIFFFAGFKNLSGADVFVAVVS